MGQNDTWATHSLSSGKESFITDDPKYRQKVLRLDQCFTMSTENAGWNILACILKKK